MMSLTNTMFFNAVSCFFICAGLIITLILTINVIFHKQSTEIVNIIWVLTGLRGHYFTLFAYYTFGIRKDSMVGVAPVESMEMDMKMPMGVDMPDMCPKWQSIILSTFHCGAGCTLADFVGERFTYWVPLRIGRSLIASSWIPDFVLALVIGVFFQFAAIREMEKISFSKTVSRVFRAGFFLLLAWQVGVYGWTAIVIFVLFTDAPLERTFWTLWFMMQIAMFFGLILSYPTNALSTKTSIKKGM